MSTGRNDPCPCGSGKKYKKCCFLREFTSVGKDELIKQRLVQDILAFVKKKYKDRLDEALDFFWEDFVPEDYLDHAGLVMTDINFWEWIVFDWQPDDDGKTVIDHYLKANQNLGDSEMNVLAIMNEAVISLYEVQDVYPEEGLLLKDLLLGGEYEVSEKSATHYLKKWDILATRLLRLDGRHIMSGCGYPYPLGQKEGIIDFIKRDYKNYKQEFPKADKKKYLKDTSDMFNFFWYDIIQNPNIPKLVTTTGEPLLLSKAIFDITDKEAVINGLKTVREFQQEEDGNFIWVNEQDTILGTIFVKERRLKLECNSKERLERGKKIILEALHGFVSHRADEYEDVIQAMKARKEKPAKPTDEMPLAIQQQVYTQHMRKYYENWLNENIPALKGKTPMEAVKTKAGKARVVEILKGIENIEEGNRKAGRAHIDVSWMWERLGLKQV